MERIRMKNGQALSPFRVAQIAVCLVLVVIAIVGARIAPSAAQAAEGAEGCEIAKFKGPDGQGRETLAICSGVDGDDAFYRIGHRSLTGTSLTKSVNNGDEDFMTFVVYQQEITDNEEAFKRVVLAQVMSDEAGWHSDIDVDDPAAQEVLKSEEGRNALAKLQD